MEKKEPGEIEALKQKKTGTVATQIEKKQREIDALDQRLLRMNDQLKAQGYDAIRTEATDRNEVVLVKNGHGDMFLIKELRAIDKDDGKHLQYFMVQQVQSPQDARKLQPQNARRDLLTGETAAYGDPVIVTADVKTESDGTRTLSIYNYNPTNQATTREF